MHLSMADDGKRELCEMDDGERLMLDLPPPPAGPKRSRRGRVVKISALIAVVALGAIIFLKVMSFDTPPRVDQAQQVANSRVRDQEAKWLLTVDLAGSHATLDGGPEGSCQYSGAILVGWPGSGVSWKVPGPDLATATDQLTQALTERGYTTGTSSPNPTLAYESGKAFTRRVDGGMVIEVSVSSEQTATASGIDAVIAIVPNHGCPNGVGS